ncbi:unnamed protein product [Schistosoma guineensis]|nr:unnamed protein product [Schistosoma intercalatum]CAH8509185.1 unnamed protein product [Schistosoma intercalatum]CAH8514111.1 unnamed protein product [Schistosoma guineensis]
MVLGGDLEEALSVFGELRKGPKAEYYFKWSVLSFGCCLTIHHIISPWIFTRYNKLYRNLPRPHRMEWDSRVVSSIHATIVSILCVTALVTNADLWYNPAISVAHSGLMALSISIGYFLCDAISMPFYWRNNQLIIFLLHHAAACLAFFYVVRYRTCVFFGVYRLTTELSTPFVNQRWFYRTIGYKPDRRRVACVTLIFAIFFIITRNLMILPFWFIAYISYGSDVQKICARSFPLIVPIFVCSCGLLDCLNIHWAFRTCRLGYKAAKLLWTADWQSDICKARAHLHKRLRNLQQRVAFKAKNNTSLKPTLIENHHSNTSLSEQISSGLSSSNYSTSDSELESVYSDLDFKVTPENDKDLTISNSIYPNSSQNLIDDDIKLVHRS